MRVKDCMTKAVVTVKRSTTLAELIEVFRKFNYHTLPVVEEEGDRLVGVVTFEDIWKVFQPYGADVTRMLKTIPFLGEVREEEDILMADISADMGKLVVVDDLMNIQFATVDENVDIIKARSLMRVHKVNRLPVVKKGRLVGILSLFDIILAIFREKGLVER